MSKKIFQLLVSSYLILPLFFVMNIGCIFAQSDIWVGTWSCAPYAAGSNTPPSPYLENNTLRQVVRVSIGGETLRMKFSNKTCSTPVTMNSVKIAISTGGSTIDASTITELKFNESSSVTMDPYSSVTSDPIDFSLNSGDQVAITIYYGEATSSSDMTFHYGSRTDSYILSGDQSSSSTFSDATIVERWYHINTIDVKASSTSGCVGVIGNSITDGYGLHGGLKNKWTDIFSEQLLNNASTNDVGVLNLGIGGTMVSGSGATTGLSRYKEDLLQQSGLRWIIIFYGTNDIAYGGTSDGIISAFQTIINDAHTRNIKVYGATITPFKGHSHYSTTHEDMRNTVNEWIRTSGEFDAVIDFDNAIKDPDDNEKLLAEYSNDWLHPNADGYAFLGNSVDINLFTEINDNYPLVADAGEDQIAIDYENKGSQSVNLDGSGSFDFGNDISTFVWSLNGTQIATGEKPTVSLPVGENTITLTVTDVDGNTASDEVIITINEGFGVWIEAECGSVGSLWDIVSNENASNEKYITVKTGNNSTSSAPTDESGISTYTFNVDEEGTYYFYARLTCPNANDDSFWIKMDNGSYSMWNGITAPSWQWIKYGSSFYLSKGSHTLTIAYREDGALLDKLWITNTVADVLDEGGTASNCETTSIKNDIIEDIKVYPNPVSKTVNVSLPSSSYTVNLYDSNGQKLVSKNAISNETTLSMSNYYSGIYFVEITVNQDVVVKKIIKI